MGKKASPKQPKVEIGRHANNQGSVPSLSNEVPAAVVRLYPKTRRTEVSQYPQTAGSLDDAKINAERFSSHVRTVAIDMEKQHLDALLHFHEWCFGTKEQETVYVEIGIYGVITSEHAFQASLMGLLLKFIGPHVNLDHAPRFLSGDPTGTFRLTIGWPGGVQTSQESHRLTVGDRETIPSLIERLDHPEKSIRLAAVNAMLPVGHEAVAALIEALEHKNPIRRENAAWALAEIAPSDDAMTAALMTALDDGEPAVRRQALRSLCQIGPSDLAVTAALQRMVAADNDADQVILATLIKSQGRSAIPALIDALSNPETNIRHAAAGLLKDFQEYASLIRPELLRLLDDAGATGNARLRALDVLGHLGHDPKISVPILIRLFDADENSHLPEMAVFALTKIGLPAIAFLLDSLSIKKDATIKWCATTLAQLAIIAKKSGPDQLIFVEALRPAVSILNGLSSEANVAGLSPKAVDAVEYAGAVLDRILLAKDKEKEHTRSAELGEHVNPKRDPLEQKPARPQENEPQKPAQPADVESLKEELSETVGKIISRLPADSREKLSAVDALNGVYRRAIRSPLQEAIREILQAKEGPTLFAGVQQDSQKINQVLQDLNYAILDPETNLPASVIPHRRNKHATEGSFPRLQDKWARKNERRHMSSSTRNLSSIDIVESSSRG